MKHIPAKYIGEQTWPAGTRYPSLPLYNLLVDIPGHPVGSTVSLYTLWKEGYHPVEKTGLAHNHSGEEMTMTTHTHTPTTVHNLPFNGAILATCSCGARSRSDNQPIIGGTLDLDGWYIATPDDSRAAYDLLQSEGHVDGQEPRDMYDEFDRPSGQ